MFPSTEGTDAQCEFAADVLRNLLRYIDSENGKGRDPFLVSHAWIEGPMMYLVYTAPPSDRTWGLVRDTRQSIIDPGPWPDLDERCSTTTCSISSRTKRPHLFVGQVSPTPFGGSAFRAKVSLSARQTFKRRIGIRH